MPPPYGQPPYGGDAQYSRAQYAPGAFTFQVPSIPSQSFPAHSQHLAGPPQPLSNAHTYGRVGSAFNGTGLPFDGAGFPPGRDLFGQGSRVNNVAQPPPRPTGAQQFAEDAFFGMPGVPPDVFGAAPKATHADALAGGRGPVLPTRPGPMRDVQVLPNGLGHAHERAEHIATGRAFEGLGEY